MTFHIAVPGPMDHPESNRRRHGRIRCQGVTCCVGEVVQMSASGARIRTKAGRLRVGQQTSVRIAGLDGEIEVQARVVWLKPQSDSEGSSGQDAPHGGEDQHREQDRRDRKTGRSESKSKASAARGDAEVAGVEFIEVSDASAKALRDLARASAGNTTLGGRSSAA